jgi:hypothetical protein
MTNESGIPKCTNPKGHNWGSVIALTGNYKWCDNCGIEVAGGKVIGRRRKEQ